jgi:hypothetical protein
MNGLCVMLHDCTDIDIPWKAKHDCKCCDIVRIANDQGWPEPSNYTRDNNRYGHIQCILYICTILASPANVYNA